MIDVTCGKYVSKKILCSSRDIVPSSSKQIGSGPSSVFLMKSITVPLGSHLFKSTAVASAMNAIAPSKFLLCMSV